MRRDPKGSWARKLVHVETKWFAKRSGLSTTAVLECERESGKKQTNPGICGIGAFGCRCRGFPCARPRMCRLEVWAAALNLIEALSHTPIKQFLDGSKLKFIKLYRALAHRNQHAKILASLLQRTEASRMLRGGKKPTVRCTALTTASCERPTIR